ncbi:MAG: hypothetical protein H6727_15265 [Myxococcales bacterium]|nr:hypothetical protein [Myxococcales bacterium]
MCLSSLRAWLHIGLFLGILSQHTLVSAETTKRRTYKPPTEDKRQPEIIKYNSISSPAVLELKQWLKGWSPSSEPASGIYAMSEVIRTYVAFRYARKYERAASERLWKMYLAFGAWNPKELYQKLRQKKINPHLSMKVEEEHVQISAPKGSWQRGLGKGGMTLDVQPLPNIRGNPHRPFRVKATGALGIAPVRIAEIDRLLHDFMKRALSPDLSVEPSARGPRRYFPSIKETQSRKIADWLTSRLPRTTVLMDRYFDIRSVVTPMSEGRYKLDLKLFWRNENIKTDYPSWYKAQKKNRVRVFFQVEFLDSLYRRWFTLTYSNKKNYYRVEAVVHADGFLMCDDSWKPTVASEPWRPTHKLQSEFLTRTQLFFSSNNINFGVSDILFRWKVRPHKDGASLNFAFNRPPRLQIQGGRFLRSLARVVIPGGVSALFQRLLTDMTKGDGGKGMRFQLRLVEGPKYADVRYDLQFPVVPNSVLSAVLLMIPGMLTRTPRRGRKPRPRRKAAPRKPAKPNPVRARYRLRRVLPAFWQRVLSAIGYDLQDAHQKALDEKL